MKRVLLFTLLSSLFFSATSPSIYAESPKENVIIVFKDDIDYKAVKSVNGVIEEVLENVPIATGEVPSAAIELLENNKEVLAVEVDQKLSINAQTQDWGIQAVNGPASWASQYSGKGIKIAVLDTGIAPHEDLVIAGGVSFTSYTSSYTDDNGHGTHVAGIIGAKDNAIGTVGIAHEADIFAVKVLDKDGNGYVSDIIKGIDWSISNKMDIINLSFGTSTDSIALRQAVDKAYSSSVLLVAAAGNDGNADGSGETVDFPARFDSVIAVSATDSANRRGNFSSTGNTVEVAAPGVNIVSTYLNNKYAGLSGTSMAAPYASGTLALLKQANPTLSHVQLREKLKETAIDIGPAGKDMFFGYGLVQAPVKTQKTETVTEEYQTQPVQETTPAAPVKAKPTVEQKPIPQPGKKATKVPLVKPVLKKNFTATSTTGKSELQGR